MAPTLQYDQRCLELARHFLPQEAPETPLLAAHIFHTVDTFLHPAVPAVAPRETQTELDEAYQSWWNSLTREGDPLHIPNKFRRAFEAGWNAAREGGR